MGLLKFIFGSYDIEDSVKKLISSSEVIVKDLSEKEYLKLLGKKSSIKKKNTYHLPLIHWAKVTTSFSYKGMAGTFDLQRWNKEMKLYNQTLSENKRLKERYEDMMMKYEHNKQLYNNAKMQRNQIIASARPGNKLLPYIANPIGSPPKKPVLKLLKLPKVPKDKKNYTIFNKPVSDYKELKNIMVSIYITSFENFNKFNSCHELDNEFKEIFKSLFESFLKLQSKYLKKKSGDTLEKVLSSHNKKLKFNFGGTDKTGEIPFFPKHDEKKGRVIKLKQKEPLDEVIINACKKEIILRLENGDLGPSKNVVLKDVKVDITQCAYSIPVTFPLSLQFINYNDGKKNKTGIIDYIGKKLISLK
tara:strand:- start:201 stop:1280 length:1080 start_codon:yes stop_codon:yes gene_type:complete